MEISIGGTVYSLPDFMIIGGARCGTSSLYSYLREHPEIFMPDLKEPHFFNYLKLKKSPHPDRAPWTLDDYAAMFEYASPAQKIGEASASYLFFHDIVIPTLQSIYGEKARYVKIVIVLRNPIDRAWSQHMLLKRNGYEMSFFEMVEKYCSGKEKTFHNFIGAGYYNEPIQDYLNSFESVKIFMFEDLMRNRVSVVRNIFELIGVNHTEFIPQNISTTYNASGISRSGLSRFVYKLMFNDITFKKFFKHILPLRWRLSVKAQVGAKVMKKIEMPADVHQFLSNNYRESIRSLRDILIDPAQKAVVDRWLM
jgi:hypothetical protein